MTIITCTLCHEQKQHVARGLCRTCYGRVRYRRLLYAFDTGRRAAPAGKRTNYWREWKRQRRQQLCPKVQSTSI